MTTAPASVSVEDIAFRVLPMKTRFPFQYGIASLTDLPHLFVIANLTINGRRQKGISSEGLPPKWFTKDPDTTFDEDLPAIFSVIRHAATLAMSISPRESYYDWWRELYGSQSDWAASAGIPPLLANLGVSLVERAVLDGLCRSLAVPFASAVASNLLGIRLGEIYPELGDADPSDLLPREPHPHITARHTIGLGDPLTEEDITEPLGDGLPHSLEACIAAYGLDHFKIKICGHLEGDRDRLRRLRSVLERATGGNYRLTLDGNEQYPTITAFREHWESHLEDDEIRSLFEHLIFVEQPIHRDHALDERVQDSLIEWRTAPPLIIDESDARIGSALEALALGYSGTSHKNCKGIVKGIANAALLEHRRRANPERPLILSGEDLGNVGPIALLQDLTVMATLGIRHVERNGHHYFKGLSMFPPGTQIKVLESHDDLYLRHPDGFATLRIESGRLHIKSLLESPFGTAFLTDTSGLSELDGSQLDPTA